jgi:membrane associated rhomboid family serine protease
MFAQLPPATRAILFLNIGVFLAQLATRHAFDELFALMPLGPYFHAWQLVTYAFLHAKRFWGPQRFVVYYLACVLAAALVQLATMTLSGVGEPTIGASGGVFGLLLAFALYFPRQRIILLFPPIPMPAWLFVTLYGLLELFLGVSGYQMGVAHFAHLGGMLGGAVVILYWRARGLEPRY